jgi:hypothetical protein
MVLAAITMAGCGSPPPAPPGPPENAYANQTEAAVRSILGIPDHEFAGHYGAPPLQFTQSFTGEIKTLVFKKPGGSHYVTFEKRANGWIGICSSWLPAGGAF